MRLLRVLAAATGIAALLAQPSAAQEGRTFKDAWFWGVKGGGLYYHTTAGASGVAPMVGAEWLITRTFGGLYASFDQSFLSTSAHYKEPFVTGDPNVTVKNVHRFSVAAVAFPLQSPTLHPYVGIGVSLHQVGTAELASPIAIPALASAAQDSINDKKVAIAPLLIAGAQKRLPLFSVFAQGTAGFVPKGFFLHNPDPERGVLLSVELGLRYNIGSSIDRTP